MIKGSQFQAFERERIKKEKLDVQRNFRIVEALYEEAAAPGIFPLKNPLEGIEVDIRIAAAVNHVPKTA